MTITARPDLKEINNKYSPRELQHNLECVLESSGYDYQKNGSAELIVEGDKDTIKKLVYSKMIVPKVILETAFGFYQSGNSVYIRMTLQ